MISFITAMRACREPELSYVREKTKLLRALGIKASHPDDGWHNREERYFQLAYPDFDDGVKVGDVVMLTGTNITFKVKRIEDSRFKNLGGLKRYYY